MLVIVEQHNVIQRNKLVALFDLDLGRRDSARHTLFHFPLKPAHGLNGRMKPKGGATDSTGLHLSWEVVPGSELP